MAVGENATRGRVACEATAVAITAAARQDGLVAEGSAGTSGCTSKSSTTAVAVAEHCDDKSDGVTTGTCSKASAHVEPVALVGLTSDDCELQSSSLRPDGR